MPAVTFNESDECGHHRAEEVRHNRKTRDAVWLKSINPTSCNIFRSLKLFHQNSCQYGILTAFNPSRRPVSEGLRRCILINMRKVALVMHVCHRNCPSWSSNSWPLQTYSRDSTFFSSVIYSHHYCNCVYQIFKCSCERHLERFSWHVSWFWTSKTVFNFTCLLSTDDEW